MDKYFKRHIDSYLNQWKLDVNKKPLLHWVTFTKTSRHWINTNTSPFNNQKSHPATKIFVAGQLFLLYISKNYLLNNCSSVNLPTFR